MRWESFKRSGSNVARLAMLVGLVALPSVAAALDSFVINVKGDDDDLRKALRSASLTREVSADDAADPRDILAAATADYARLLDALYAQGYYGPVIHILIDGREAAGMSPFEPPARIGAVRITVDPGRRFQFGQARVAPLPPNPTETPDFQPGEPARSTAIIGAVETGISDWRDVGHAKANVASQRVIADHNAARLDADIALDPGPLVRFGNLVQQNTSRVRSERVDWIAAFPRGQVFSPEELDAVGERLRRTGAFSSVALTEADTLTADNRMDIELTLSDAPKRRAGVGVELSSLDGLTLSAFWMHRNLLRGAERLRFDAEISDIGGSGNPIDLSLSGRFDIPAALGRKTDAFFTASLDYVDDPAFSLIEAGVGAGIHRIVNREFEYEAGVALHALESKDDLGTRRFRILSLPASATWDRRDSQLDPETGFYVSTDLEPFHDLAGSATGLRSWLDGRTYRSLGDGNVVLAGRAQIGALTGADAQTVPPDYLFFSGGGGLVRGFPHQSLGIDLGGGMTIGGRAFLGLSGEVRYKFNDTFGLVGFADVGHVGADTFFDAAGGWQTGAGLGLRYYTGLGPIRLDVAMPVSGAGGDGMQLYIGIGQAF